MRDLIQNHMLQLLCHVAMGPPVKLTADAGVRRAFDLLDVDEDNPDDMLLLPLVCRARDLA